MVCLVSQKHLSIAEITTHALRIILVDQTLVQGSEPEVA